MNTQEKITEIADAYCADNDNKILATIDLRDGRAISLTVEDFFNLQELFEGH